MNLKRFGSASTTTIPINNGIQAPSTLFSRLLHSIINRRAAPLIILVIAVLAIFFLGKQILVTGGKKSTSSKTEVAGPKATASLGKEFSFPINDAKGNELTRIKYLLETAELRDEIIVKGQKASTVEGRIFLILTVKVTNDYDKAIEINTRDFVRLSLNNNDREWLAADIHNDPVNVRAISTKTTRLGFAINDSDKNLVLRVGEINSTKQSFPINF